MRERVCQRAEERRVWVRLNERVCVCVSEWNAFVPA